MTKPIPDPTRVTAYLTSHGWHQEWPVGASGTMFAYCELSDDGEAITVFVPSSAAFDDYPLRVADVVDTVAAIEGRSKDAVRSDLVAASAPAGPASALTG